MGRQRRDSLRKSSKRRANRKTNATSKGIHSTSPSQSTRRTRFRYQPLEDRQDSFRLFRLYPGDGEEQLQCQLFNAKLSEWKGRYYAGSYACGSENELQSILVNGHRLFITQNLFEFLCAYRRHCAGQDVPLWIDAICISQESIAERNHQVQMMTSIYTNCICVYSWLGQTHSDIDWLLDSVGQIEFLAKLASLVVDRIQRPSSRNDNPQCELCNGEGHTRFLGCVFDKIAILGRLQYWTRMWIVQELFLPPNIVLLCGERVLLWTNLCVCLIILSRQQDVEDLALVEDSLTNSTMFSIHTLRQERLSGKQSATFQSIYAQFRKLSCSLWQDRFFALLGMTEALSDESRSSLVDYSLSKAQLILQLLRSCRFEHPLHFVEEAIQDLDVSLQGLWADVSPLPKGSFEIDLHVQSSSGNETLPLSTRLGSTKMFQKSVECHLVSREDASGVTERYLYAVFEDAGEGEWHFVRIGPREEFIIGYDKDSAFGIIGFRKKLRPRSSPDFVMHKSSRCIKRWLDLVNGAIVVSQYPLVEHQEWVTISFQYRSFLESAWHGKDYPDRL